MSKNNQPLEDMSVEELNKTLASSQGKSSIAGVGMLLCLVLIVVSIFIDNNNLTMIAFIGFFCSLAAGIVIQKNHRQDEIVALIAQRTLGTIFDDVQYSKKVSTEEQQQIRNYFKQIYKLTTTGSFCNRFLTEDRITGKMNGVAFEIIDVCAQYAQRRHTETIFKGQYLRFQTSKRLNCDLLIRRKGYVERKNERDGGIITDNPRFNERWYVKSDSPHEALYVLTPQFMEQLERFETITSKELGITGKTDYIFLSDGTIIAFVDSRADLLEFDITKNMTDERAGVAAQVKTYENISQDFLNEGRWLYNIMNTLGAGRI